MALGELLSSWVLIFFYVWRGAVSANGLSGVWVYSTVLYCTVLFCRHLILTPVRLYKYRLSGVLAEWVSVFMRTFFPPLLFWFVGVVLLLRRFSGRMM